MKLIAKKPCSFGGVKFYIGDEVPVELVHDPKTQEKYGTLAIVNDGGQVAPDVAPSASSDAMELVVHAEEGDMPLNVSKDGIQAVVDAVTGTADDAVAIVKAMTDGDALILLHMIDTRKTVKAASEARAQALNAEESEGEQ